MSRKKRKNKEHGGHREDAEQRSGTEEDLAGEKPPAASASGSEESESAQVERADADAPAPAATEAELERLTKEAAEMRDLALRTQAEFENYKKRMERERADLARHAAFEVVKEVLPVLDNLERAIRASESSPQEHLRAGVEIIQRQFQEILVRMGLSEVESQGKLFDPHLHEAVSRVETTEHPEGTIVNVFQKGYSFKDRLLRPAMVAVAQPPAGSSAKGEGLSPEDEGEVVRKSE